MAVQRQRRQFGIQPIGVSRVDTGQQPIANAIVEAADNIRRRTFDLAVGEAKERGAEAAAELDIPSITTLDEGTGVPIAMQAAEEMGRYSQQAFENVLLKRFENAVSDDIKAKQAELMQTLADSPNAPKLFETAFKEYLSATGENATGYYKQVVVDYGASAMEDGRSRLRVAQIARIQAEAKEAKNKRANAFLELAYNQGASGVDTFNQFFENATNIKSEYTDYEGIGAASSNEYPELYGKAQQQFAAGKINTMLQDPDLAKQAAQIYTFFSTGGSQAVFNTLSPKAQDAVNEIKSVSSVENPLDFLEVAKNNSSTFTQAEQAGVIVSAKEQELIDLRNAAVKAALQEDEAIARMHQQRLDAAIDAQKNRATDIDVTLNRALNSEDYTGFGEHGTRIQINALINDLNELQSDIDPTVVGADAFNKNTNHISNAKEQIGIGILKRSLKNLNDKQAEQLSKALGAGDTAAIVGFLPPLLSKAFLASYSPSSYAKFQGIASDWAAGKKITTDANTARSKLILKDQKRIVAGMLRDESLGIRDKANAYEEFIKQFSGNAAVANELVSARADLDSLLQTAQNKSNNEIYQRESFLQQSSAGPDNLQGVISAILEIGQKTNQDPDTILNDSQKVIDEVARQFVTTGTTAFGNDEFSIAQIQAMSEYAATKVASDDLMPAAKEIIDQALAGKQTVLGNLIEPDNIALSETLSSAANRRKKAMDSRRIAQNNIKFESNYLGGKPINDAGNPAVQAKASSVAAKAVGLPSVPTDLFEKPASQLSAEEFELLGVIKNNSNVLPVEFAGSANRLLNGTMDSQNIPSFIVNTREFLFRETANGDITISPAAFAALGEKKSAKLETMFMAYKSAPIGREGSYMQEIAQSLKEPLTKETFKAITGYSEAGVLLAELGVPSYLIDELIPVANGFASVFGEDAVDNLESAIESRFPENNNGYSPWTGGSRVPLDASMFVNDMEKFEEGVAEIVKNIDPDLRFEIGSKVSIDDLRSEAGFIGMIDVAEVGEKVRSRLRDRVFYGPSMSSSMLNPRFELYKSDEFGMISIIPNSGFNLNTIEIAMSMGTALPPQTVRPPIALSADPEAVNLTAPPKGKQISDSSIKASLSPEQQTTLSEQVQRQEELGKLKYSPVPTGPIIEADKDLIATVSRITGSGSEASKIIKSFNNIETAGQMRTEITKVIHVTEDLPQTKGRDKLLERLYEVRDSLRGKTR